MEGTSPGRSTCEGPEPSRLTAIKRARVYAVNGSAYFNRPGPRIVDGLEILAEILHPEVFPTRSQGTGWQRLP